MTQDTQPAHATPEDQDVWMHLAQEVLGDDARDIRIGDPEEANGQAYAATQMYWKNPVGEWRSTLLIAADEPNPPAVYVEATDDTWHAFTGSWHCRCGPDCNTHGDDFPTKD